MRPFFSLVCFLSLMSAFSAQVPTITANNYFQLGEQYVRLNKFDVEITSFSQWQNGANVVWDFSTLDFDQPSVIQDTISCIAPFDTPFFDDEQTNYNLSNYCLKIDAEPYSYVDDDYSYYQLLNNSLQFIGNWADNGGSEQWFYSFDNSRTELVFPFTYLDSFTDSFESSYNDMSGSDWHYQSGSTTVVADGYGTLITPDNDTLINILHVATNNTYVDSNELFGITNHTDVYYTWYSADFDGPILQVLMASYTGLVASNVYYYKKIPEPIESTQDIEKANVLQIFPNPTVDSFQLKTINHGNITQVSIRDCTGKLVYTCSKNLVSDPMVSPHLKSGVYFVEAMINNQPSVQKLIIQ